MASLFGEFQPEKMDINKSRGFVMGGLDEMLRKGMGKAATQYGRQGWGGRLHAPTVKSSLQSPYVSAAADAGRSALTDLYFKDKDLGLRERQTDLMEDKWSSQYELIEDQRRGMRKKEAGGKYVCTSLYKQGLLSLSHIKNDLKFLKNHVTKEEHQDYSRWAKPLAELMDRNKLVTLLVYPFIKLWSGYMNAVVKGDKVPLLGLIVHKAGLSFGKLYKLICKKGALLCRG